MEIRVDVHGTSCHGSAPDRGDNAIYKMADIIADVRALNNNGCDESTDIKGLVKMLDPQVQSRALRGRPLPGAAAPAPSARSSTPAPAAAPWPIPAPSPSTVA